jgi:hypothetical protein
MADDYQIEIPPSFIALYSDARHRLTVPLAWLRERYEVCEDLAQQLIESAQHIHHDLGVPQHEVLQRMQAGLLTPDSGFDAAQARWVLLRLTELLGWGWDWDWDRG